MFGLNESMREKSKRMKALNDLIRQAEDYTRLKPIVDTIPPKGGWGKKHEKYMAVHNNEIRQFYAVKRKLDNADIPGKKLTPEKWQRELDALKAKYDAEKTEVSNINAELKPLRDIQYQVNTYLHDHQHDRQQQQKQDNWTFGIQNIEDSSRRTWILLWQITHFLRGTKTTGKSP